MEVLYRTLELDECDRIRELNASQYIGRAWRKSLAGRQPYPGVKHGTPTLHLLYHPQIHFLHGSQNPDTQLWQNRCAIACRSWVSGFCPIGIYRVTLHMLV